MPVLVPRRLRLALAALLCSAVALPVAALAVPGGQQAPPPVAPAPSGLPAGGPEVLHRPLASAPQLENGGIWKADPILVSGASAYRDGEFLYQDFLYDDLGDGSSPYPADRAAYADNAADLVEVRLRPLPGATAVRLTYNTLLRPELTATTLALGGTAAGPKRPWPHGARVSSPAEVFVTVHGDRAEVVDAATGQPRAAAVPVTVDARRFQVELRVPHAVLDTAGRTDVRVAAATGVWDPAAGAYRAPDSGAALYNVAFRYDETTHPRGVPVATWFRETGQRAALAAGDLTRYAAVVDLRRLSRGVDDDMRDQVGGVPTTGSMSRINVTHFSPAPGRGTVSDQSTACDPPSCTPEFSGRLQQYFVHVPATRPAGGYGLAIYNHGCGNNQNEVFGSRYARELSTLDGGTIVMAANGRAGCLWYQGVAGASIFETWADVAARYPLDPRSVVVTGYSMGGYGTQMLATTYPDLFSRALGLHPCTQTGVAPTASPDGVLPLLPSLRHVPLALWNSVDDPLCQYATTRQVAADLDGRNYAYSLYTLANDHFTDITNDVFSPVMSWLGAGAVATDPGHVSYVVQPSLAFPRYGLDPASRVYWLRDLRTRSAGTGSVDARSGGLGEGTATALPLRVSAGVLTGGDVAPLPYTAESRDPGAAPTAPLRDRLDLTVRNLAAVTVDPVRAGLGCQAELVVDSDGPVEVTLAGCRRTETFGAG